MEYWLESAHLDKVHQEAGVQDPNWIPPSKLRAGCTLSQDTDSSCELKLLQTEMVKMKRDMQELILKKQEKNELNMLEETHKELVKWKATAEERLNVIITSLKGMQGMYCELVVTWKSKVEQQLAEITNKLSNLQASREHTTFSSPSERWKDWLESTNLDNILGDELAPDLRNELQII